MVNQLKGKFRFEDFEFDADRTVLYSAGNYVSVENQALKVLAVLLKTPGEVVLTSEIIDEVWADSPAGITPTHVSQNISKLRKAFAERRPDQTFIETSPRRGYRFVPDVEPVEPVHVTPAQLVQEPAAVPAVGVPVFETPPTVVIPPVPERAPRLRNKFLLASLLVVGVMLASGWIFGVGDLLGGRANDRAEIERVVRESQFFESLVLYQDPASFREEQLDKYWKAESGDATARFDRKNLRTGVANLVGKGQYYGDGTRNEIFEFQSVEINKDRSKALVKTLEKWFIAIYQLDGKLVENKYVGPYFVSYYVVKENGRWLIERSSTARATPLVPTITGIEKLSEPKHLSEFFVRIKGTDLDPDSVFVRIIGPGCPEERPCTVPNTAIRQFGDPKPDAIERLPLTLATGEYQILLQNGESPASPPQDLKIP